MSHPPSAITPQPSPGQSLHCDLPTPHPRHVEEFRDLYEKRFGAHLSSQQALEQLISLLVIVNYRQHNACYKEGQPMK